MTMMAMVIKRRVMVMAMVCASIEVTQGPPVARVCST